jgi:hypothetical protein
MQFDYSLPFAGGAPSAANTTAAAGGNAGELIAYLVTVELY